LYDIGYRQSLQGQFSASCSGFVEDLVAQLADPMDGDRLLVLFTAIDCQYVARFFYTKNSMQISNRTLLYLDIFLLYAALLLHFT